MVRKNGRHPVRIAQLSKGVRNTRHAEGRVFGFNYTAPVESLATDGLFTPGGNQLVWPTVSRHALINDRESLKGITESTDGIVTTISYYLERRIITSAIAKRIIKLHGVDESNIKLEQFSASHQNNVKFHCKNMTTFEGSGGSVLLAAHPTSHTLESALTDINDFSELFGISARMNYKGKLLLGVWQDHEAASNAHKMFKTHIADNGGVLLTFGGVSIPKLFV
jgi:hypothetical protein